MVMKVVVWFLFLCGLLFFSLGKDIIPHLDPVKKRKKYKTATDYYSDLNASFGAFSKREGMTNRGIRYIEIVNSTQKTPAHIQIGEINAFDESGVDVAKNKTTTSRGEWPGYVAKNAVDGNANTMYHSASPPTPNDFW